MHFKKVIVGAGLVLAAVMVSGFENKENYQLVEETYIVRYGDTLWSIAGKYMDKNTYGRRDIREFISGIVELNYNRTFKGREPALIYPGDELRVNYWVKKK